MKSNKIIYIILVIVFLIGLASIILLFNNKKEDIEDNTNSSSTEEKETIKYIPFKYMNYTFSVPSNMGIRNFDNNSFIIDYKDTDYIVSVSSSETVDFKSLDELYTNRMEKGFDKSKVKFYKTKIDNVDTVVYESIVENEYICFFINDMNLYYRIIVEYKDNNYKLNDMSDVLKVVLNPTVEK